VGSGWWDTHSKPLLLLTQNREILKLLLADRRVDVLLPEHTCSGYGRNEKTYVHPLEILPPLFGGLECFYEMMLSFGVDLSVTLASQEILRQTLTFRDKDFYMHLAKMKKKIEVIQANIVSVSFLLDDVDLQDDKIDLFRVLDIL